MPNNPLGPRPGGSASALDVSANRVVKATPGTCYRITVLVAGAAGTLNDCAAIGDAATANEFFVVPATVGTYELTWPCAVGIVYKPGAAQVVSIAYS